MTKDDIQQAFDQFFEFPEGSDKLTVTSVSAKLFAEYCVEQVKKENESVQKELDHIKKRLYDGLRN